VSLLTKIGLGVVAVMMALTSTYMHGYSTAAANWKAIVAQANAQHATELAALQQQARDSEHAHAQQLADIDQQHQKDIQHEISSRDAVIADLRAGTVSLRKRFTCAAAGNERVPSTATSTSGSDAAGAGGLSADDASVLVRLASRADEVALQLQACQAVVRADRDGR
jgi:hypothetical protein